MSDAISNPDFQKIRQCLNTLRQGQEHSWAEVDGVLEDLHVIYEQMQTNLEVARVVEEELLQQSQRLAMDYYYYHDLFQSSPIAYLVTNAQGTILEANEAIAHLLNLPQHYLSGKPLALYIAEGDRHTFRTQLNQLAHHTGPQIWQLSLCPPKQPPLPVELHINPARNDAEKITLLRIGIYVPAMLPAAEPLLPQSLDGLRVLVVDDEADAREFITLVLESHGVEVRAVNSAAKALQVLAQFHPDVLVSDIRMPDQDGYSLIQQIRALEAAEGRHIPAAAITAYLEEDRDKALTAGFEAHLHKLAQPIEWVEMVAQLAGREARTED